ncbi:glycerophosphodiester phosphodiesterase [Dysgonomonas sp. OttesenSCG-928-M03]|nr:glycerophosphodiester phosphodiesterase [Dysgonomonas sp. OttesenSCG-928-M03]
MMKIKVFAILVLTIMTSVQLNAQTKVVAHRGYWDCENSAQNSIVALYKAHETGVYGSEFDVLITADGIPVVNHDDKIEGKVIEETTYEELRDIKLKNGETLPTLEQYLVHGKACRGTKLILEIKPHKTKDAENKAVDATIKLVREKGLQEQVEYISFSMNICKELKRLHPNAIIAYLKGDVSPAELKQLGMSGLDYHYNVFSEHPEWIRDAHDLGLFINVWTVNDVKIMKDLINRGVDFITTDKPEFLKEVLAGRVN